MSELQLNLSFHNIDSMVKNLDIFHRSDNGYNARYSIIRSLKVNEKRGIYLVKDNEKSYREKKDVLKVLKFILQVNTTKEHMIVFNFYNKLKHHNFCKIESIEVLDRFIIFVQEYIDGLTLDEYFRNGISKAQKYRILFDMVFALDYIHSNSIVHGDIKPDNIIVRTNKNDKKFGTPVIIDYDLGKDLSKTHIRPTKRPFGTTLYMSPEMIDDQFFDYKTDIWSLGMTLYSCIIPSKEIQQDLYHTSANKYNSPNSPNKFKSRSIRSPSNTSRSITSPSNSNSSRRISCASLDIPNDYNYSKKRSIDNNYNNHSLLTPKNSKLSKRSSGRFILQDFDLTTSSTGNNTYDFDYMVQQLIKNQDMIQSEHGSLFFNSIRVMLLKDHRKRPSASKLKDLLIKSDYYDKLYSSPKNKDINRIGLLKRSSNSGNSDKSDKSDNLNDEKNKKDSGKVLDICINDANGNEYKIPKLDIGDDNDVI